MEKNPGYIVETSKGIKGRTYHREGLINGKTVVHIKKDDKDLKLLCDPDSLKIIGFID